jgi:hypothetical protein
MNDKTEELLIQAKKLSKEKNKKAEINEKKLNYK